VLLMLVAALTLAAVSEINYSIALCIEFTSSVAAITAYSWRQIMHSSVRACLKLSTRISQVLLLCTYILQSPVASAINDVCTQQQYSASCSGAQLLSTNYGCCRELRFRCRCYHNLYTLCYNSSDTAVT
jgi:hypothetical protein